MYKLIAFDLDGTLTQHRSKLCAENKRVLDELCKKYKVIMVGAGGCERIYEQMEHYPIDIIGNYGMQESIIENGVFKIIRSDFYTADKEYFENAATKIREKYGYTEFKGDNVFFHDTGMVTIPLLGTDADIADKVAFDPDRSKRKPMYEFVKAFFPDYNVFIGGSSSFDIAKFEFNKYNALVRYMNEHGYKPEELMYVGDDFGDGGGDSHVRLGGLNYTFIDDYRKLPEKLEFLLK